MGKSLINLWIMEWTQYRPIDYFSNQSIPIPLLKLIYELFCGLWLVSFETSSLWDDKPRYFIKGSAELIGSFPSNQNTLYLLCLFYSDNEIITVCCRPEICTLIGWIEASRLCLSFSKVSLEVQSKTYRVFIDWIIFHLFTPLKFDSDWTMSNLFLTAQRVSLSRIT